MLLNCPAAHDVHLVPPSDRKVSVIEPAGHTEHAMRAAAVWYWPALHRAHATVDAELNCPAMHTTHRVALVDDSASVIDPGLHTAHTEVDMLL